jgi:hypothetical protein
LSFRLDQRLNRYVIGDIVSGWDSDPDGCQERGEQTRLNQG